MEARGAVEGFESIAVSHPESGLELLLEEWLAEGAPLEHRLLCAPLAMLCRAASEGRRRTASPARIRDVQLGTPGPSHSPVRAGLVSISSSPLP